MALGNPDSNPGGGVSINSLRLEGYAVDGILEGEPTTELHVHNLETGEENVVPVRQIFVTENGETSTVFIPTRQR